MKLVLLLLCLVSLSSFAEQCYSSKEFVTFYRFLDSNDHWPLSKQAKQDISYAVAKGCNGAAKRAISMVELMDKAKLPIDSSMILAQDYALLSDSDLEGFVIVFKETFLAEYLDLDINTAIKLASSVHPVANYKSADMAKDFKKVADFCLSTEGLSGPKLQCSELATNLLDKSKVLGAKAGGLFIDCFQFIRKNAIAEDVKQIEKTCTDLLSYGPTSVENFSNAYKFAIDEKGLELDRSKAFEFAKKLSVLSTKTATSN